MFWRQSTARAADVGIGNLHTGLGADPMQLMTVTGQLNGSPGSDRLLLDYGPTTAFGQTVRAELRTVDNTLTGKAPQYYLHGTLHGLEPGTSYRYRLRTSSGVVSPVGTVRTAPAGPGPFRFTAFGDEDVTTDSAAVLDLLRRQRPDFHLLAGDICYADSTGAGLPVDSFDPTQWDRYFARVTASAASTPWLFGTGNHDMEAVYGNHGYGGFTQRIDVPGNGAPGCPTTFSFKYGNVAFLSVDFNDVSSEIPTNLGYSGGAQRTWLADRLRRYRAASSGVDFVVVLGHHALYGTSSAHGSDGGVRAAFGPLFDQYRVDLVVNGHAHCYERTDPIRGGAATRGVAPGGTVRARTDGTTYVTAGGGGASAVGFTGPVSDGTAADNAPVTSFVNGAPGVHTPETVTWSRVRRTGHGLLVVDASPAAAGRGPRLTVRYLAADGSVGDRFVLGT